MGRHDRRVRLQKFELQHIEVVVEDMTSEHLIKLLDLF
jgi:hypothetical protein